ncbi:glycosyltransferase [Patescibacteria group bacterium]|nr:glycosyltransferase [Patescibacteria group bacterium]
MKVAAIVPALNEEANIGNVLKVLLKSKDLDEVILVDDGSEDRTAEIGEEMGVKVIKLPKKGGSGKGNAMKKGVESTDADIIAFFDADLIGLTTEHVSLVVRPVLENRAVMCVGARQRYGGLPKLFIKIDPLLAVGGERAMKRFVFESIPERFIQGFAVETSLNYYCRKKKLKVLYPELKDLTVVIKEKKWGLLKGFKNRMKMFWQLFKIRVLILTNRKEF